MQREIHTVIGAGQIGSKLAERLLARGHQVRLVRRGDAGPQHANLEWRRGDITDRAFADEACRGSAVVYDCVNAPYDKWDELLRPLARGVRDAAARAGARLVVLDNLYMYGVPPDGAPMTEDTPLAPCSHKGALRAELARELAEACARGDVRAAAGRASDFFGPASPRASIFRPRTYQQLARGRAAEVLGDPDLPHAYSYTPDVAEGLAVLGDHPDATGVWHLPVAWNGTTRALLDAFSHALRGHPARLRRLPTWLLRTAGLVAPVLAAVVEMTYQWEAPFQLDDTRFRTTFRVEPTPIDRAIAETLADSSELEQARPSTTLRAPRSAPLRTNG